MSSELQLAALLCSRICHDLISPISALNNGLEVLEEDNDPEMREHALSLLSLSGRQASFKLQFARLAYGSSSAAEGEIDLTEAHSNLANLLDGGRFELIWDVPAQTLKQDLVKILMNFIVIATEAIPRGGKITVTMSSEPGHTILRVAAKGEAAQIKDETRKALEGELDVDSLDARLVQPYYAGLLVRSCNGRMSLDQIDNTEVALSIEA